MGQRKFRLNPMQTIFLQRQSAKERRAQPERMNRRANIVDKPWQREFSRAGAAADSVVRLQHKYRMAFLRQPNGSSQAVRAGTHYHRVVSKILRHSVALRKPQPGARI